jgi:ionotropic glutamate receptor NMDA 2B
MAPPIEHQVRAMFALLKRYNWPKFGVVYSKMAGGENFLETVQQEILSVDDRTFKLELLHHVEIDDKLGPEHIRKQLKSLRETDARILLVYSTAKRLKSVFEIAEILDLLSNEYLWIATQSVKGSMGTAVNSMQHGMLSVNFHTVSQSMFPPPNDVLTLIIGLAPKVYFNR